MWNVLSCTGLKFMLQVPNSWARHAIRTICHPFLRALTCLRPYPYPVSLYNNAPRFLMAKRLYRLRMTNNSPRFQVANRRLPVDEEDRKIPPLRVALAWYHSRFFDEQLDSAVGAIDFVCGSGS